MKSVLVVYASRMGSTGEIASRVGERLTRRGYEVDVHSTATARDARLYDAVIVGSAVYLRRWDRTALRYLQAQAPDLAERPTWLFQSGPCGTGARTERCGLPVRSPGSAPRSASPHPSPLAATWTRRGPRPGCRAGSRRATWPVTRVTGTRSTPGPTVSPTSWSRLARWPLSSQLSLFGPSSASNTLQRLESIMTATLDQTLCPGRHEHIRIAG